ncbi:MULTISPECIES: FecCD family ABC transporter permease [unclassified Corynebacterium]|uniref:FecCD family ABC transporter permease n=1 Tax=unclassified Corynebacterium TaxID=2624378 RepID=UPI0034CE04C3
MIRWLTLIALAVLGVVVSVMQGDLALSFSDVVAVFTGGGSAAHRAVILEFRLGRAVVALVVGAALAYSGALTQSVARNGLASPDILGVTNGASLAAVAAIVFGWGMTPVAAILGAALTAVAMVFLAGRGRSMVQIVLVGVGLSMFLSSLTTWLLAYAQLDRAASARMWMAGSLNGRDWHHAWVPLATVVIAVALAGWLSFQLAALSLGDATAHILGHNVRLAQLIQLLVAVVLAAVAVAAAGPIGFLAFVSPHVARMVSRAPTPPLLFSAAVGATALLWADIVARVVLPWPLPVGVVTAFLGAPLLFILVMRTRAKETV